MAAREPWKVEREDCRVFLRIGNYEFEIKLPASNIADPEYLSRATEQLLTEKMEAVTSG